MRQRKDRRSTEPRLRPLTIEVDDVLMEAIEGYAFLHGCTNEAAAVGAIYQALVRQPVRRKIEASQPAEKGDASQPAAMAPVA